MLFDDLEEVPKDVDALVPGVLDLGMELYSEQGAVEAFHGLDAAGVGAVFGALLQDPVTMAGYMIAIVLLCGGSLVWASSNPSP